MNSSLWQGRGRGGGGVRGEWQGYVCGLPCEDRHQNLMFPKCFSELAQKYGCHLSFVVPIRHAKLRREQKELNMCGPNAMPLSLGNFFLAHCPLVCSRVFVEWDVYCLCVCLFFFFKGKLIESVGSDYDL